jgi:hypothetical protein
LSQSDLGLTFEEEIFTSEHDEHIDYYNASIYMENLKDLLDKIKTDENAGLPAQYNLRLAGHSSVSRLTSLFGLLIISVQMMVPKDFYSEAIGVGTVLNDGYVGSINTNRVIRFLINRNTMELNNYLRFYCVALRNILFSPHSKISDHIIKTDKRFEYFKNDQRFVEIISKKYQIMIEKKIDEFQLEMQKIIVDYSETYHEGRFIETIAMLSLANYEKEEFCNRATNVQTNEIKSEYAKKVCQVLSDVIDNFNLAKELFNTIDMIETGVIANAAQQKNQLQLEEFVKPAVEIS